jgi:hypothetical protein
MDIGVPVCFKMGIGSHSCDCDVQFTDEREKGRPCLTPLVRYMLVLLISLSLRILACARAD